MTNVCHHHGPPRQVTYAVTLAHPGTSGLDQLRAAVADALTNAADSVPGSAVYVEHLDRHDDEPQGHEPLAPGALDLLAGILGITASWRRGRARRG